MGRKRAAFADGIAEEEQRYAQVLRDIRDLRGETQQALGRADWLERLGRCPGSRPPPSVLMRPRTGATARWPQPRSCASG
jgi:hypothetical protein